MPTLANVEYLVGMCVLSVAIVAHSDAEFGMSRMAEILAEETGVELRAFHNTEDALAWLAAEHPH